MTLLATVTHSQVTAITWDVVVLGAGVAGALAARQLSLAGMRVLLVEKQAFPRAKVCGACLNAAALDLCANVGLGKSIDALAGPVFDRIALHRGSAKLNLRLPTGRVISRELLDSTLVETAIAAGVEFLPLTTAAVGRDTASGRVVELVQHETHFSITARAVVVATGLGPPGIPAGTEWQKVVSPFSRIGAGCVLEDASDDYGLGTIWMVLGAGGYVGLVRLHDGTVNVAAALDVDLVRASGSPGIAVQELLVGARCAVPERLVEADWRGTLMMTRSTVPVASRRVFLIGDAAGYVEPFTGEGMAWGISAALHVVHWVRRAVRGWSDDLARGWIGEHRRLFRRRQSLCRVLSRGLRSSALLTGGTYLLQRWPWLVEPVIRSLNRPASQDVTELYTGRP
jgi:flavin-dependent dehydrogenase